MTLDDLRVFVDVCETGSLAAVARRLGCTQPAVSQHVRALERELHVQLIARGPRGVSPTLAGTHFRTAAVEVLGTLDAVRRRVAITGSEPRAVRIVTGGTTVRHFLQAALHDFGRAYPETTLEFQTVDSTTRCIEMLVRDAADLAFVTVAEYPHRVDHRHVVTVRWCLLVKTEGTFETAQDVEASELATARLIALPERSTSYLQLLAALAGHGVHPRVAARADNWDTAALLVEAGMGEAIIPEVHARQLARPGMTRAVTINGLPPISFGWAARRWDALAPACLAFVDTWQARYFGAHD